MDLDLIFLLPFFGQFPEFHSLIVPGGGFLQGFLFAVRQFMLAGWKIRCVIQDVNPDVRIDRFADISRFLQRGSRGQEFLRPVF